MPFLLCDSMRIDVIMLISGLDPEALKDREKIVQKLGSKGTQVKLVRTRNAPSSVESFAEMELAAPGIMERVVQSEQEGADAVVIWGGHDPSVVSSRELVEIPVIGPGMASMHLASLLAEQFALMVQLPHVINIAEKQVRDLGLEAKCTGIYPVGLPVLELRKPEAFQQVYETAIKAVEDGANSICFGCMALNDHADRLAMELEKKYPGVKVIHPGKAAVRLAELLVEMGLTHSKRSYPVPRKPVIFP